MRRWPRVRRSGDRAKDRSLGAWHRRIAGPDRLFPPRVRAGTHAPATTVLRTGELQASADPRQFRRTLSTPVVLTELSGHRLALFLGQASSACPPRRRSYG